MSTGSSTVQTGQLTDDHLFLSAAEQRQKLDAGHLTSLDLTRAYLERIERVNAGLAAFVQVDAEGALAQAAAADARLAVGERTPVLGLCVGIKDLIDVKGLITTYGSAAYADNLAAEDAPVVRRLREAGAVILGKVNTTEFAMFTPSTLHGPSKNCWALDRSAGGSSNGSGTATSAGLCSFAVGTDTAGSIRTPASFNGVFGLKPTHGRVSAEGIGELSTFMDTVGPFGRSPTDIALALQTMAGFEPDDLTSAEQEVPNYLAASAKGADGLVIGVPEGYMAQSLDPVIEREWHATISALEAQGAIIRPVELPDFSENMMIFRGLMVGDTLLWHSDGLATRGELYSDNARMMFSGAEGATAVEVAQARKDRWKLRRAFMAALEDVDVLILPGAPILAPLLTEVDTGMMTSGDRKVGGEVMLDYAIPFNITGLPALVMPVALSPEEKVPVPIMIGAKPFREDLILQAAAAVSAARPFNTRPLCYR